MKRILLLVLFSLSTTIALAQTTWTGLGANTNWNNTDNWDTNLVPTAADDVIIPTGFDVTLNVTGTVKSIVLEGNATFNINTNLNFSEASSFASGTTISWNSGSITGSGATIINDGLIVISSNNVTLSSATTLTNNGTIRFESSADIFIATNAVLNNSATGVIDFLGDDSGFTGSGSTPRILNNEGLIKTTFLDITDKTSIGVELINNGGTIQVENGTLNLSSAGTELNDAIINIFPDATLDWDTTIALSGALTGSIEGVLNWRSTANVSGSASFDFSGTETITWVSGALAAGGTLTNESTIAVSGNVTLSTLTTLENNGNINLISSGDIFIATNGVINNNTSAVIDLQGDDSGFTGSGAAPRILNNQGLIKTSFLDITDKSSIGVELFNNGGTIQVENGTLNFSSAGIELAGGVYNVFAGATLDWDTTILIGGELTGEVNGDFNWRGTVNVPTSATFNFSGTERITWVSGSLVSGGTLTNETTIEV
ncbi:MAG: hypothetical protein HRU26_05785, partial [Psychroserpens sp.]|nr:hypothetical protein [Psychroserpens sp.]